MTNRTIAWARPTFADHKGPEGYHPGDLVDVEFHTRAEQPDGKGWVPLVIHQPKARCGNVHHEIDAYIWLRESTNEWVLELQGVIDDTSFIIRHPQPSTLTPAEAIGLPTLYQKEPETLEEKKADALRKLRDAERAMYEYFRECPIGREREMANAVYENIRNATRLTSSR